MQGNRNSSPAARKGYETASIEASFPDYKCDDLLERAFQLTYFIVQDRSVAINTVNRARQRLSTEQSREKKRIYWRHKSLKQNIRRMTRDGQDALQWLIYLESEEYEKRQEQEERPTKRSLGMRYIKSIVQMTSNLSCFYVAVGLHRILHDYATPDLQIAYESLTEDFAGAEKYRRVKRALMRKLAARFGKFITLRQSDNQELRFDVCENQGDWVDLATDCLEMFTPWSTRDACPSQAGSGALSRDQFLSGANRRDVQPDVDVEEMRRCHIFMHPPCFDKLTHSLKLDPRAARLAMPRFKMNGDQDFEDKLHWSRSSVPPLSDEERAAIMQHSGTRQSPHRSMIPNSLTILADGVPCAQLNLSRETLSQWKVDEGTRLIEFCTDVAGTTHVLAMHWVDYTDLGGIAAGEHIVSLGNYGRLVLKTIPAEQEGHDAGSATMLAVSSLSHFAGYKEWVQSFFLSQRLPRYVITAALVLLGWLWSVNRYQQTIVKQQSVIAKSERDRASTEEALASLRRQLAVAEPKGEVLTYRLLPDSLSVRGAGSREIPVVVLSHSTLLVELELPLYRKYSRTFYRATLKFFSDKKVVLRADLLEPKQTEKRLVIVLTLPSTVMEDRKRYVITLESMNGAAVTRIGDFSFYLQKQ